MNLLYKIIKKMMAGESIKECEACFNKTEMSAKENLIRIPELNSARLLYANTFLCGECVFTLNKVLASKPLKGYKDLQATETVNALDRKSRKNLSGFSNRGFSAADKAFLKMFQTELNLFIQTTDKQPYL